MREKPLAHLVLDVLDSGACLIDEAGRVQAMNKGAERMTGYRESELAGNPFPGRLKIAGASSNPAIAWLLAPARQWVGVSIKRKDEKEVQAQCAVFRLGAEGASGVLLKLRPEDASGAENAALEDTKLKLEAIFGGMADGLILIDELGKILLFTAGAEKLFGYSAKEVAGANVRILMPSPYHEEHDRYLANYRETGTRKIIGIGREVSGKRKDGGVFPMYLSIGEIWLEGRRFFVGVTHDLTRAKRVESRLWMLSAAVEQSPVAVLISNRDGLIEYVNGRFTELTGYREEEVVGQNPRILQSGETPLEYYKKLWETIAAGGEWRGEIRDRRKNGELYWAHQTISPLRDDDGRIRHYLAIQQDVTQQRRDKEALAESEERFRKVAAMVGEWLWEQDAEGRYIYSSDAVRDVLGLEPQELIGKSYLSLFGPPVGGSGAETVPAGSAYRHPFHRIVNSYLRRDGRCVYTESSGTPIFDETGRLVKWRGVDRDITAQKAYEDALRVRNRAMEAVHVGIVIFDARRPGNPNIYVNPALARMTGYTQQELLQSGMNILKGPGTDPAALADIRTAIRTGASCEVTLKNYRKNGEAFWNEVAISPVPDEKGEITHFIGIQTDVTEKRRAEESRRDLEIAKEIQLSLLPDRPLRLPGAEVSGVCLPATHVGGDYFDYFDNADDVDFLIADVSGHSVGAALIMTSVRSMVRAHARSQTRSNPCRLLHDLNDLLHDDLIKSDLFITMAACRYSPGARTLKYASAGHNPGVLLRANEESCMTLDSEGLILGVRCSVDFEELSLSLSPGDRLLLYTDGITEAQDASGLFFGLDRLCASFLASRSLSPEATMGKLLRDVRRFCGPAAIDDDIALVVLEVK